MSSKKSYFISQSKKLWKKANKWRESLRQGVVLDTGVDVWTGKRLTAKQKDVLGRDIDPATSRRTAPIDLSIRDKSDELYDLKVAAITEGIEGQKAALGAASGPILPGATKYGLVIADPKDLEKELEKTKQNDYVQMLHFIKQQFDRDSDPVKKKWFSQIDVWGIREKEISACFQSLDKLKRLIEIYVKGPQTPKDMQDLFLMSKTVQDGNWVTLAPAYIRNGSNLAKLYWALTIPLQMMLGLLPVSAGGLAPYDLGADPLGQFSDPDRKGKYAGGLLARHGSAAGTAIHNLRPGRARKEHVTGPATSIYRSATTPSIYK